jgi:hypothetical protein
VLIDGKKRDSKGTAFGSSVEELLEIVGLGAGFCSSPPV